MSWHKPSKRQRAEELGLITPLGRRPDFEQNIAEAGTPSRDLFDLLADRAAAKSGRDAELQSLQRAQREHAAAMEDARLEIGRLQAEVQRARVMGAAREEENSQRIALLEKRLETEARVGARSAAELAAAKASLEDAARKADAVLISTLRERVAAAEQLAVQVPALRESARWAWVAVFARERLTAAEERCERLEALLASADEAAVEGVAALRTLRRWESELTEAEAARLTAALEERRRDAARAERRVALLLRERSGLQAVLSSYDEEYLGGARGEAGIAPQQARLAELEATVEGLHAHVADLEAELERRGAGGGGDVGGKDDVSHAASARQLAEAQARADAAEALAERLRAEGEALAARAEALQARVARGDFDPATTRVLHLRLNPEAELAREARDARVERLESENAALAQSLARLEALEGEVSLLRRRANELQKANDRLQQVFRRQITQFREAVYLLFGYRVEMMTDPSAREIRARFVLRPQHEDEGAELVFDLLRSGVLALVPTALTTGRLAQEAATFVDRFRSIPAFTANLTLENFQRQTQS
ncbi:Mitotic spindle assembly checkpoint protein MAD1 [Auxenochlorella protothecoides]|uniref:Mitotic spindle assembly checkpoint protein MAD1 n=1 Tax=Auxenochlorella protothecoides TaxID=3075 RepID=A0A087SAJ5_AUXPR|nr:Mitotic spindle assembly checkpoint protein MAD1 [Auxenochlorella protothecoides]KFM22749.1 Mitotic spindle assembly checkpoint protein MAD1 [Auxenochlorella protothecoides]